MVAVRLEAQAQEAGPLPLPQHQPEEVLQAQEQEPLLLEPAQALVRLQAEEPVPEQVREPVLARVLVQAGFARAQFHIPTTRQLCFV